MDRKGIVCPANSTRLDSGWRRAMENVRLISAVWLGLALLASTVSIRVAMSVALVEIMVGAVAGNIIGLQLRD